MDQDERAEGAAVSAPAGSDDAQETRSSDEIRSDIDDTREEVGDTVEALAAKTDVKAQARARVEEIKGNVRAKAARQAHHCGDGVLATVIDHDIGSELLRGVEPEPRRRTSSAP